MRAQVRGRAAREAKLEALQRELTDAVSALVTGEDWKRALTFAAQFRSRSFNNTMLIHAQHCAAFQAGRVPDPAPTYVAGFHQWLSLGRHVVKGQQGYAILAPVTARFASTNPADAGSWRRLGRGEKPSVGETVRSRLLGLKPTHVWDISQTAGDPIPKPPRPVLLRGEAPTGLWDGLADQITGQGFELRLVSSASAIGGANGLTDFLAREASVRMDMDDAAQVKTLAHELGHVLLHAPRDDVLSTSAAADATLHRGIAEVEAESVALTLIWTGLGARVSSGGSPARRRLGVMRVRATRGVDGLEVRLVDGDGETVDVVTGYLRYLGARGCSPNTVRGYAYDLLHLWRFLEYPGLGWDELRPRSSIDLLTFLRSEPTGSTAQRLALSAVGPSGAPKLSASTINRILTGVGGFYEWAIATEQYEGVNPIERRPDPAWQRVTDRHRPFVGEASRQRPQRRVLKVRQPQRLPRPLSEEQVDALFGKVACLRDRAMLLLMLNGGLRRARIREPWVTLHGLRHTHATRMWEGGMRALTLQRRLGHASVESTRRYTRVADDEVAADYLRALGQRNDQDGRNGEQDRGRTGGRDGGAR